METSKGALSAIKNSKFAVIDIPNQGQISIPLPLGLNLPKGANFSIDTDQNNLAKFYINDGQSKVQIYPFYNSKDVFDKDKVLEIYNVHDYSERVAIQELLKQHYIKPTDGITLIGKYRGEIISCAILGRLTFGKPIKRVEYFQEKDSSLDAETIHKKNILWVKRFIARSNYKGMGIGKIMAEHVVEYAKTFFFPKPEAIEVITSRELDDVEKNGERYEHDFIESSGYKYCGMWKGHVKRLNKENAYVNTRVYKFYYIYDFNPKGVD